MAAYKHYQASFERLLEAFLTPVFQKYENHFLGDKMLPTLKSFNVELNSGLYTPSLGAQKGFLLIWGLFSLFF